MKSGLPFLILFMALTTVPARAADDYTLGPDSFPRDGVPRGTVTTTSAAGPSASRDSIKTAIAARIEFLIS